MSSTNEPDPNSATWWFRLALGDLSASHAVAANSALAPRFASALAQQAAEKALKAVIALGGADPPRTHDLLALAARAHRRGLEIGETVGLAALTDAGSAGRYPDPDELPPSPLDVAELIADADTVIALVEAHLRVQGVDPSELRPA